MKRRALEADQLGIHEAKYRSGLDERAFDERKARNTRVVAAAALELGTREAARRFGISKNTVTDYLRLAMGVEPMQLRLRVRRDGPRGFQAEASGRVRQLRGKVRHSVPFTCSAKASTLRLVLDAVLRQALVVATRKAGVR